MNDSYAIKRIQYSDLIKEHSPESFNDLALEIFRFQAENLKAYKDYLNLLGIQAKEVNDVYKIPFLPIQFYKTHRIIREGIEPQKCFKSSGTTGQVQSKHHVSDLDLYERSFLTAFEQFYGNPSEYRILALLPSYLERNDSSLIYMVSKLMEVSDNDENAFFLNEFEDLAKQLKACKLKKQKCILIGVSFALMDFVESHSLQFPELIVMETGGMKGKRKELMREELHRFLSASFGVSTIHSEYGMTELLSQAYSKGNGIFSCPSWMRIHIRDLNDPFSYRQANKTGAINIIDLANINSCSFIATEDLGYQLDEHTFKVIGRINGSDIRGCNLMVL